MELPDDVLSIIKEFSRPITRPDWRTLHKMTHIHFYIDIYANGYLSILTDATSILLFKNMILFFENDVFCVFRFQYFLNDS
jgi:hypothetical protein